MFSEEFTSALITMEDHNYNICSKNYNERIEENKWKDLYNLSLSFTKDVGYQRSSGINPLDPVDDLMQRTLLMMGKDSDQPLSFGRVALVLLVHSLL